MQYLLMFLMAVTGLFLILIVLLQRGRGGGLAGAFGGSGGQSAFGTKAGDVFTRVTIGAATFWILLCAFSVKILSTSDSKFDPSLGGAATTRETPGAAGGERDSGKTDSEKPASDKPVGEEPAAESSAPAESAESPAGDAAAPATGDADASTTLPATDDGK
jgi:preprotein translocase subunit SecG